MAGLTEQDQARIIRAVSSELMKNCEPYVPLDKGTLIGSGHLEEDGSCVVWDTPYARRWYYEPANFQGAPMRGNYWADRYLQSGGIKQLQAVARYMIKQ